jgi:ankyrin repeat protein
MEKSLASIKLVEIYMLINDNSLDRHMPLFAAVGKGNLQLTQFLIHHPLYKDLSEKEYLSLLKKAADQDHVVVFDYLLKHANLNIKSKFDAVNIFERCCTLACKNMIEYLISPNYECRVDINKTKGLVYACDQERKDIVQYLLEKGADVSNDSYSALIICVQNDIHDMLSYLLFETDIDLAHARKLLSEVETKLPEKELQQRVLTTIDNAILTKSLHQGLSTKACKKLGTKI